MGMAENAGSTANTVPRHAAGPPGWPRSVPPPTMPGWQQRAVPWLLDVCPPDYRHYRGWTTNPYALAWLAIRHLDAQITSMRESYRLARTELADAVTPEALSEILGHLEREGLRLVDARRSASLMYDALQGKHYVPRL